MIPMTLAEVAAAVGGEVCEGDAGTLVTAPAFVDSRAPEVGGLFVAVAGDHVDGHDFAAAAVAAGAAAALAARPVGVPAVVVDDPVVALGRLARHVVDSLPRLTVLAVTGSQGKTSTKDLLAHVLAAAGPTVASAGSLNNELGVPLTVLRADADTRFLVVEMGARGEGHIRYLCKIAPPDVSLVLNVGKAHLGEFGSQQGIARAKGELVEALEPKGTAVLNADDPLVAAMQERTAGAVLRFGESDRAEVHAGDVRVDDQGRASFTLSHGDQSIPVALRLVGEHHVGNAAGAAAAAVAVGLPLTEVARSLSSAEPSSRWRMEIHERHDGVAVVNDAYNANPDSMRAALKALAAMARGRGPGTRTVAVLGEMRELGEASREEHDAIGRLAVRLDISQLVVVGEGARPIHLGACLEGSWAGESVFVPDTDEAVRWLQDWLRPSDVVLVKASRAAALERVADALLAERQEERNR